MRILYLDLDALSPSHLSCYGYHRETSPTIDRVASQGMRFTNVYCSDAPCLPSRTAFYQARFGIQTGVVGHGGTAADFKREGGDRSFSTTYDRECFPSQLQNAGFRTAMISPFGQRHGAHHFYAGFKEMHNTGYNGRESADVIQPVVERWLKQNASQDNWYLHVNFWDTHTSYGVPMDYGNPFENDPLPAWITDEVLEKHIKTVGGHSAQDLGMYTDVDNEKLPRIPKRIIDRQSLRKWIDAYDTAIRYVDDQVAKIIQLLKDAGVYDETAIIISADHGENQGEFGIYGEHATADQATCNIPFVVRWPDANKAGQMLQAGTVNDALHYHLDWAPTCLELLGEQDRCKDIWDGQSFAPAFHGMQSAGRDELIISQCAHVCQRSVRFKNWLYIRTYHDGFRLFPKHMLFDVTNDPHELHDVADEHPAVLREATWRLADWHDAQMHKMVRHASDITDPMWTVLYEGGPFHARLHPHRPADHKKFETYLERLQQTGRTDGAEALRKKYLSP